MAFATTEDIEQRLGRDLSADADQITLLIESASNMIRAAANKPDNWEDEIDPEVDPPVPAILRTICIEMVARSYGNPTGVTQQSESIGGYQISQTFDGQLVGLTTHERQEVSRAVHGSSNASPRMPSVIDDVFPLESNPLDSEDMHDPE